MPAMTKHRTAITADARKIEARNGGSITKKRMAPLTNATIDATIATARLTLRNWFIRLCGTPARLSLCVAAALAINAAVASAQPQQIGESGLSWQQRF